MLKKSVWRLREKSDFEEMKLKLTYFVV